MMMECGVTRASPRSSQKEDTTTEGDPCLRAERRRIRAKKADSPGGDGNQNNKKKHFPSAGGEGLVHFAFRENASQ